MKNTFIGLFVLLFVIGCSTPQKVVQTQPLAPTIQHDGGKNAPAQRILKRKVAIARFSNETQYAKGVFYDKENDPLGNQALDILSTRLTSSEKFILLERNDFDKIEEELALAGNENIQKLGADYLIIGSVTKYGRKNVGDVNAFSRSKTQTVEAAVSLRLIDASTGQVIYSEEAEGEAETTSKTSFGLGERTGYDATLNDEAISVAISKLVENIINNCMEKPWRSYFINYDENGILISGGETQGILKGDTFAVLQKGKQVKNPQTGMMIELPGVQVGIIKVEYTGGDSRQNEYSLVTFSDGHINRNDLENYYVTEINDEK